MQMVLTSEELLEVAIEPAEVLNKGKCKKQKNVQM